MGPLVFNHDAENCDDSKCPADVGVHVHLGSEVWGVVHAFSVSEQIFVVEAPEEETLFTRHPKHVIVVLIIDNLDRSLSVGVGSSDGQGVRGDSILIVRLNFRSTISPVRAIRVRDATPHVCSHLCEHLPNFVLSNRH